MTYSRVTEQLASWTWIVLMAIVGAIGVHYTISAVRDIARVGLSWQTLSMFLLVGGTAVVGLSNAMATLLFALSPRRFAKSPRWFLVTLAIAVVMIILGAVRMLK